MRSWVKGLILVAVVIGAAAGYAAWWLGTRDAREPSRVAYAEHCASCHGSALEGTDLGPALVGAPLQHGDGTDALLQSIGAGFPERGMPGWAGVLSTEGVKGLALVVDLVLLPALVARREATE